ncbi:MAG: TonB-dependent receptor, partial [Bacteroidia bacterium]|nr:TonB-dependent receptor [Bacteroidia bacterium]
LILLYCSIGLSSFNRIVAQTIVGRVVNQELKNEPYSKVYLLNLPDSVIQRSTIADSLGRFRFQGFGAGNFLLVAENYRFQPAFANLKVDSGATYRQQLKLGLQVTDLKGGGISVRREGVQQKNDTFEFNASNYKVNPDATAENLITKMPGITNENGTIKAQGEEIKKVTVDGQDFFGDDAAAALKNLPAEIVDKIQVFDRSSDQAAFTGIDDGNSQKTLNIVTKNGKNNGQFGKIYAGYGTNDRWAAGGNVNYFKGKTRLSVIGMSNNINQQNFTSQDIVGLTGSAGGSGMRGSPPGGNFRRPGGGDMANYLVNQQNGINTTNSLGLNFSAFGMKKMKLTASYFFNHGINEASSFFNRTYFLSSFSNQLYFQGDTSSNTSFNHRLNLRLEYSIDSNNSIIYSPSVRYQSSNLKSVFNANTKTQELDTLNGSGSRSNSNGNGLNITNNLLLRHRFKSPGHTISLNLNHSFNSNTGNGDLIALNEYFEPLYSKNEFSQISENTSISHTFSPNLSYTQPVSKKSTIELNYNPSLTISKSKKFTEKFDSTTNAYTKIDSLLSNSYDNSITTQKLGATYRYKSEKLSFNLGLNAQRVILKGVQSFPNDITVSKPFDNLLPNAMLTWQPSKSKNLRIYYRSSNNIPSVSQLQNVIDNSNPLILSSGNAELKQEFSHRVFFRYSVSNALKGRSFFWFAHASTTANFISNNNLLALSDTIINLNNTELSLNKGTQINLPTNLNGYRSFRTFATFGMPMVIKKFKSTVNLNVGQSITKSPTLINNIVNYSNTYNSNAGLVLASNMSENLDFTIMYGANYNVVVNSLQNSANSTYLINNFNFKLNYLPTQHIVFSADITNSTYSGLGSGFNQSIWLVNGGLGYKFLKNNRGELKLSVFDALKKNNSISRTVTENYIEDRTTQILTRFYMVTFTYSIRNFNANAAKKKS